MAAAIPLAELRILREAAQLLRHGGYSRRPIWRRRLKRIDSRLDRDYVLELGRDLVLRVLDAKTREEVCCSLPGEPERLDWQRVMHA